MLCTRYVYVCISPPAARTQIRDSAAAFLSSIIINPFSIRCFKYRYINLSVFSWFISFVVFYFKVSYLIVHPFNILGEVV